MTKLQPEISLRVAEMSVSVTVERVGDPEIDHQLAGFLERQAQVVQVHELGLGSANPTILYSVRMVTLPETWTSLSDVTDLLRQYIETYFVSWGKEGIKVD